MDQMVETRQRFDQWS